MSQELIPDVQLQDNTSERTPCIIIVDGSASMSGDPILQLNQGLVQLEKELKADATASIRVQLLIIRIGDLDSVDVLTDWTDAINFTAPVVMANGSTPLGKGALVALDKIVEQKRAYDHNGISSKRPWLFLISDGAPTDPDWEAAAQKCQDAERSNKVVVFPIGTTSADLDALGRFSTRGSKQLDGLQFRELFVWLSRSVSSASKASPGTAVQLAPPDWSTAST
jgi:uncharacterized protein YegL